MARKSGFLSPEARKGAVEAVRSVEAASSAEVVICVRRFSGRYLAADLLFGSLFAMGFLCVLLFAPTPFPVETMPAEVLFAYLLGAFLCSFCPCLRRWLTCRKHMEENVRRSARSAFFDGGVFRTEGGTGVLVYASLLERRVEVVCDRGILFSAADPDWKEVLDSLQKSVRRHSDVRPFLAALRAMGPVLAKRHPRQADDANELPDEVTFA